MLKYYLGIFLSLSLLSCSKKNNDDADKNPVLSKAPSYLKGQDTVIVQQKFITFTRE
jgi:hypothetical protein